MPVGVGLTNEATIKLKVELDSRGINGVKKLLTDLTNAFNAQKASKQMSVYQKTLSGVRNDLAKTKKELTAAQKALNAMGASMQKQARTTKNFGDSINTLRGRIEHFEKKFDAVFRASYRLQMTGANLQRFSRTIIDFGNKIMDTYGKFEFTLNRAAGALEIWKDSTFDGANGIEVLQEKVLAASKEMHLFPAEEVAQGLYFWGSATGQVVDDLSKLDTSLKGVVSIMKTAAMTNSDYEATIKGVYSILSQFYGGALEHTEDVTQKLFLTTQKTAAEFNDLIQAFKMVGPVAAQMGVTFDEVNSIMGRLADLGLRGSLPGRALRQLFIQTIRPSGPASAATARLFGELSEETFGGQSFYEIVFPEGEYIGILKHMRVLAKATMHLTSADRQAHLARISTANMLPIITALVADQRRELLQLGETTKKVSDDAQKAADEARTFFTNNWELLSTSWNAIRGTLSRAMEALYIEIGSVLKDRLQPFIDSLVKTVERIREFVNANPHLIAQLGKMATALAVLAGVGGLLFTVTGALLGLAGAIGVVVGSVGPLIPKAGAVVGILVALSSAIFENWELLQTKLSPAFRDVEEAFRNLSDGGDGLADVMGGVFDSIQKAASAFVQVAADIIRVLAQLFKAFSEFEHAGNIVKLLLTFLSSLVAAKVIIGIGKLAVAITGIGRAASVAAKGVGALRASVLLLAGGPLGILLGIGVTLLTFADDIPILGDALDALANEFRNVEDSIESMDRQLGDVEISKTIKDMIDFETAVAKLAKTIAAPSPAFTKDEMTFPTLDPEQAEVLSGFQKQWAKGIDALGTRAQDAIDEAAGDVARADVTLLVESIEEKWKTIWENANVRIAKQGIAPISAFDFGTTINELFEAGVKTESAHGLQAVTATRIAEFVKQQGEFRAGDVGKLYDLFNETTGATIKDAWEAFGEDFDLSETEFRNLSVVLANAVGDLPLGASKANTEIREKIQEAIGGSFEDFDKFMMSELAYNMIPVELKDDKRFDSLTQDLLDQAIQIWLTRSNQALEELPSIKEAADGIQASVELLTEQLFLESYPDIGSISTELARAATVATPVAMKEFIDSFFRPLADGRSWSDMMMESSFPEDIRKAVQEMMKIAVEMGIDDPRVLNFIGEVATEAAGKSRRQLAESLAKGLGSGKLLMKDVKKAMKKGSTSQQIQGMMNELIGKPLAAAMSGKGANIDTRIMGRGRIGEIQGVIIDSILRADQGGRGKKKARKFLKFFDKNFDGMPQAARKSLRKVVKKVRELYGDEFVSKFFTKGEGEGKGEGGAESTGLGEAISKMLEGVPGLDSVITSAKSVGKDIGFLVVDGFAALAEDSDALGFIASGLKAVSKGSATMEDVVAAIKKDGEGLGLNALQGWADKVKGSPGLIKNAAIYAGASATVKAIPLIREQAIPVGTAFAEGMAQGIRDGIPKIDSAVEDAAASTKGGSPPKIGPLRRIDKWGFNVGSAWSGGFAKGVQKDAMEGVRAVRSLIDDNSLGSGLEIQNNTKREVRIKLEVSSPDGTVDRTKQSELRRGVLEALSVAGLEHYVTVG